MINSSIRKYLKLLFQLKEDEITKTLLLQLNVFLLITVLLIIKPTINSLFLSELTSDALPLGYVFTAVMAVIGAFFYNKMLEKYPLNKIIENTLIGSMICLILFGVGFNFNLAKGWVLYIPYVWVAIFGLLSASQFWILANLVYNVRVAKRVFGFIGAGAIAGGIFGGYLTSLLVNLIQVQNLLFIAAFLLIGCLIITRYIWKNEVVSLNKFQVSMRSDPKSESAFKLIKQSRLLSLIAIVIGIGVLIAKLVDYQFSDFASRFIEDPDELASFFGFWFSTLSVISLLIQLFFTRRIVGTFGVGKSLLWLPTGVLIGSFVLLLIPQLWVIIFIKMVDGSLKQSVNKAATELLSIPIPIETKKKTKTFTDVVVDSLATGLAGFILIFFINALDISSTYISIINIVLIFIWLYFIYHLRAAYIVSFKQLMETPNLVKKDEIDKKDIPVTSIVDTVKRVLRNGTESQVIHMLEKTLEVRDERFFTTVKGLLEHPSAKIRLLALENLYFLKSENLSSQIEEMVHDPDQQVTTSAFRYLLKNFRNDRVELFNKYLNSEDVTISNAALIGLSQELRNNHFSQNQFNLEQQISAALNRAGELTSEEEKLNKLLASLEAIGNARMASFYPLLATHLGATNPLVLPTAIKSASKTLDPQFIDPILFHLSGKETRKDSIQGLFNYGSPIIEVITQKIKTEEIDLDEAPFAVNIIEKFASQKSVNALIELTDGTEHSVRIVAIEAIKRLKWKHTHLRVNETLVVNKILDECQLYQNTLAVIHSQIVIAYRRKDKASETEAVTLARNGLIQLLEQRLDRQLQRIFRFLGIKYPPNDVDPILNSILNGKEEQRLHAIEFLDNILNKELKKQLIPVAESIMIDVTSEEIIQKLNLKVYSEEECYHALLNRKDAKLKQAVLYLIEQTGNSKFVPLVQMAAQDTNERVRNKAAEVLTIISQ